MFEKNASNKPEMPPIRRSTVAAPANKGGPLLSSNKSTPFQQNPEVKEQNKTNEGIITSSKTTV